MLCMPDGSVLTMAMAQLGQALVSNPAQADQMSPACMGAEAVELLSLRRLDQPPDEYHYQA